jgi:hypothetical protein
MIMSIRTWHEMEYKRHTLQSVPGVVKVSPLSLIPQLAEVGPPCRGQHAVQNLRTGTGIHVIRVNGSVELKVAPLCALCPH